MAYNSTHTGAQIDAAVSDVLDLQANTPDGHLDTLYKITAGITSAGVNFGSLPGFAANSKMKLVTTSHSGSGAPILYFGRNFCDFQHITHQDEYHSKFSGAVNTATLANTSASDRYFYPTSAGGFDSNTSRTNVSSSTKVFTALHNRQYLVIIRVAVHSETFNIASINIVNGTAVLGTGTPTVVDGTTYKDYYAVVTPTWTVSSWSVSNNKKDNSFVDFIVPGDAADAEDSISAMIVVDLSDLADDTTTGKSAPDIYTKYSANFADLANDQNVLSTKRHGQYYGSTLGFNMFYPYQKKWFIMYPANTYLYIRQFRTDDSGTPIGYIKTTRIGGASAGYKSIILDGEVTLGKGVIDFFYSTDTDTLPTDPSTITPTKDNAPLVQYVPSSEISLSDSSLNTKYGGNNWVSRKPGVCLYSSERAIVDAAGQPAGEFYYGPLWGSNGYSSTAANCANWGTSNPSSMPASDDITTVINLKKMLVDDLGLMTEAELNRENAIPFSSISFQGGSWGYASSITQTSAARFEYVVNGVNNALLTLESQLTDLENNSVISTLPTAAGTYKYEVPPSGGAGTWSKEEETVILGPDELTPYNLTLNSAVTNKIFYFPSINCLYIRFDGYVTTSRTAEQGQLNCGAWFGRIYGGGGGSFNSGSYIFLTDVTSGQSRFGHFDRIRDTEWGFNLGDSSVAPFTNHHIIIEAFVKPIIK